MSAAAALPFGPVDEPGLAFGGAARSGAAVGALARGPAVAEPGDLAPNETEPRPPVPDASSTRSSSIASIAPFSCSMRRAASERTPSEEVAKRSGCKTCALRRYAIRISSSEASLRTPMISYGSGMSGVASLRRSVVHGPEGAVMRLSADRALD